MEKMKPLTILLALSLYTTANSKTISFDPEKSSDHLSLTIPKRPIDTCTGIESVNLAGIQLERLPHHLVNSVNIQAISLENNLLTKIPKGILDDAKNLLCLNVARNHIPFHELLAFGHNHLKTLILSHQNSFDEDDYPMAKTLVVPNSLDTLDSEFPRLEELDLSGTEFSTFPPTFKETFPQLRHLYLNDRLVIEIDSGLFSALPRSLRSLHAQRNNIQSVDWGDVYDLEEIFLDGNPLVSWKIRFGGRSVRVLSLSNCSLTDINYNIFDGLPNLLKLDLSSNAIEDIPISAFSKNEFLESLSLSRNRLKTIPYFNSLTALTDLILSYNEIGDISSVMPIVNVKRLSLRGNRIMKIDRAAFSKLLALEELDLAENYLTTLPDSWMTNVPKLRYLNLRVNQFERIVDMGMNTAMDLRELYVGKNPFKEIDERSLNYIPDQCTVYVL